MVKSFLTGLGLGVGLGVLFAPKPGDQLREQAKEKVREVVETSRAQAGEVIAMAKRALHSEADLLNSSSREELLEVPGIGPVTADKLISGRPYESIDDLATRKSVAPSIIDALREEWAGSRRKQA